MAKILRLSEGLSIVMEIMNKAEKTQTVLRILDQMGPEGIVTLEKVQIVAYVAYRYNETPRQGAKSRPSRATDTD
jgi:PII-like signaling protein